MTSCLVDLGGCTALCVDVLSIQTLQMTGKQLLPQRIPSRTATLVAVLDAFTVALPRLPFRLQASSAVCLRLHTFLGL